MVYFSVMLKITRFPESVVYFDSNAELNIFVFLNSNHFGPGLKHLQLHCFRENVNPNFCMKYLVLSVYVVFKFNSIRRRNKKKVSNMISNIFWLRYRCCTWPWPWAEFLATFIHGRRRYHGANLCVSEERRFLVKYFSIRVR